MTVTASDLPRSIMLQVARKLSANLKAHHNKKGPKEAVLDDFIAELDAVAVDLATHVDGTTTSDATRLALVLKLDAADDEVDTWLRVCQSFLSIAAHRRTGAYRVAAGALLKAAFPDGLGHVDDYIPTENDLCRASIAALRAPASRPTLDGIHFPIAWLDAFETAIGASDASFASLEKARQAKSKHVGGAQDAEVEFAEIVVRLRKIIGGRAKRGDTAKIAEGKELLAPLTEALQKAATERAARATREAHAAEAAAPAAPAAPAATTPSSTPLKDPKDAT